MVEKNFWRKSCFGFEKLIFKNLREFSLDLQIQILFMQLF